MFHLTEVFVEMNGNGIAYFDDQSGLCVMCVM